MSMDAASVQLIIGLIAQGVGVAGELAALARRVQSGNTVTNAEIEEARAAMADAVDRWNGAAEMDHG